MSDFDTSSLPAIPNVQLQEPQLTAPGVQPPSFGTLPPLSAGTTPAPSLATGGGSPAAMTDLFGHLTNPPLAPAAAPSAADIFAPVPAAPANPLQVNGLGPISHAVNPWLANPLGVAADAQRQIDLAPAADPGLAKQQTIIHAPAITF